MLTVKHVERDGRERILQVESVDRTPEGKLVFGAENIWTGKVYIMNDAGKTVAIYDFDKHNATRNQ